METKSNSNEGKYLFAVNYVDRNTLKDCESIRTHSLERAIKMARVELSKRDKVLYSQVVVYRYSATMDSYQFVTLRNYYDNMPFYLDRNFCDSYWFDEYMENAL